MTGAKTIASAGAIHAEPTIRIIGPADLKEALAKGLDDFKAMPSHLILLVIIYPLVGLVLARMTFGYDVLPLLFPLVSGFALVGPLAAVGLYELSRRREKGLDVSWTHALSVIRSRSSRSILVLGVLQLAIYLAWLGAAQFIYVMIFGTAVPTSIAEFVGQILTTAAGWTLIIVGCGVGAAFALLVLAISVVSFPMVLDRDVGAQMAVRTSIRAVRENPIAMVQWGIIVAVLLGIGCLPVFVGLAVIMPVLGHATWHLYRKVVVN